MSGRAARLGQSLEELEPDALGGPADEAIVEGFARAVDVRRIHISPPDFRTCTMPLITRRSSTRALPRVPVGRCGAIFANCASVSQKQSRSMHGLLRDPEAQKPFLLKPLYGSGS